MSTTVELPSSSGGWTVETFVEAWEDGRFPGRVELVEGEIVAVSIGLWHGDACSAVQRLLPQPAGTRISSSSLVTGPSVPDPDCWVRRLGVDGVIPVGSRLAGWPAEAVALVVEVSDETLEEDLGRTSRVYARGGYEHYWVIAREGVHVHTEPGDLGYGSRELIGPGGVLAVPYLPGATIAVSELLPT